MTDRHLITMVSGDYGDFLKVLRLRSGSTTDSVCARHIQNEAKGQNYTWKLTSFLLEGRHAGSSSKYVLKVYFSIGCESLGKLPSLCLIFLICKMGIPIVPTS